MARGTSLDSVGTVSAWGGIGIDELERSGCRGPLDPSSRERLDRSGGAIPLDIDDVLVLMDVGALSGGDDDGVE